MNSAVHHAGSLLRLLEHAEQWGLGAGAEGFFHFDAGAEGVEAVAEFLKGVHFHVAAIGAGAAVGGARDEVFVRAFLTEAVEHAALGDDDDVFDGCVLAVGNHFFRGADFIGEEADGLGALGVGDDEGLGKFGFDAVDGVAGELDVDVAVAFPEVHFAAGLFDDPGAEVFVWDEEDGAVFGR